APHRQAERRLSRRKPQLAAQDARAERGAGARARAAGPYLRGVGEGRHGNRRLARDRDCRDRTADREARHQLSAQLLVLRQDAARAGPALARSDAQRSDAEDRTAIGQYDPMPIVITDDDAARLLSIPEAVEAMRVAFRDLAEGRAANPPRLRYSLDLADAKRRYFANIHAGAVATYQTACVRAGSHFTVVDDNATRKSYADPAPVNWTIIILYDLASGEPIAFMHETHLSGFRVGATSALAVAEAARADAQ